MKKIILFFLLFSSISACNKKADSLLANENKKDEIPAPPPFNPQIAIADITTDQCLNLEKLMSVMNQDAFNHPAQIVTTNFKPLNDISKSKRTYYSFSAFDMRQLPVNQLKLLDGVTQSDCKSVMIKSASRETLEFDVVSYNEKQLEIKLRKKFEQEMPEYKQKALADRMQPTKYVVTYNGPESLQITTTYQSFDLICENKKPLNFESTKLISWAAAVPEKYNINADFFANVKGALVAEADASTMNPESMSLDEIKRITEAPMREGLTQCFQ